MNNSGYNVDSKMNVADCNDIKVGTFILKSQVHIET